MVRIYCLFDSASGHVFYVGRTRGPVEGRLKEHILDAKAGRGKNKEKNAIIIKYLPNVEVKELSCVEYWKCVVDELRAAQKFMGEGHKLCNVYHTNAVRQKSIHQ